MHFSNFYYILRESNDPNEFQVNYNSRMETWFFRQGKDVKNISDHVLKNKNKDLRDRLWAARNVKHIDDFNFIRNNSINNFQYNLSDQEIEQL